MNEDKLYNKWFNCYNTANSLSSRGGMWTENGVGFYLRYVKGTVVPIEGLIAFAD